MGFVDGADAVEDEEKWREIRAARSDVTLELTAVVLEEDRRGEEEEKDEEGGLLILEGEMALVGLAGLVGEKEERERRDARVVVAAAVVVVQRGCFVQQKVQNALARKVELRPLTRTGKRRVAEAPEKDRMNGRVIFGMRV